jgi:hypothetical protein
MAAPPAPLELLWLAAIRADDPATVRARLLGCLQTAAVKDPEFMAEVLAVYTGIPDHTSPECRQTMVAIRSTHIKATTTWQPMAATPGDGDVRRGRLCRIIGGVGRTCPYGAYGDSYMYAVLAMRCESWRMVLTIHPRPPYAEVADQYGERTNEEVRPLLKAPIKTVLMSTDLQIAGCPIRELAAACATLSEICAEDGPTMYCDAHAVLALGHATRPSVCLFTEDFQLAIGAPAPIGVLYKNVIHYEQDGSIANTLLFWLHAAARGAAPGTPLWELGRAVIDGIAGSLSTRAGIVPLELKSGVYTVGDAPEEGSDGHDLAGGE